MAYCSHICRVLEHAQVCATETSALTWQSLLWLSFAMFSSAAHIRGLSSFTHVCSGPGRQYLQIIGACISVHDQYRPSSLLQSQTDHGRLRSLPNASRTFFTKWRTDKVFRIRCNNDVYVSAQICHVPWVGKLC